MSGWTVVPPSTPLGQPFLDTNGQPFEDTDGEPFTDLTPWAVVPPSTPE